MTVVLHTNILARAVASPTGPAGEALDRIRYDRQYNELLRAYFTIETATALSSFASTLTLR